MATTKVGIAPMKAAQIPKAGSAISRSSSARFLSRAQVTCSSKCRPVVSATVTCSRKKALGQEFSIPVFQGTKSPASSMNWVPVFPAGRRASVSVSAGTAAMTVRVARAAAEIFAIART